MSFVQMCIWTPLVVPKELVSSPMNLQMTHATPSNNLMDTIGTAEPSKSEKTAMLAMVPWAADLAEEADFKADMEHVVVSVVAAAALEVVEASAAAAAAAAMLAVGMEEAAGTEGVAVQAVPVDLAAMSRSRLHPTHSPTSPHPEERGARSSMPEM